MNSTIFGGTPHIKAIFWDFDGVLIDSMAVRDEGFRSVLQEFPIAQVNELLAYHRRNGGLSRYVKFRYFFKIIRQEEISELKVSNLASAFSVIMREKLLDQNLLIADSINFVKAHHRNFEMHIVSGSDEQELGYICQQHQLSTYFKSIQGSPTPKGQLVANVLEKFQYEKRETILIGDSINDREAAEANQIQFVGYNSIILKESGDEYINSFKDIPVERR